VISQTSEYALRAVVYLATRQGGTHASAQEISESVQVSAGYLQKILRTLSRSGILISQRGAGGGFALAKVASAISVLDVICASDTQIPRIDRCPLGIKGHTRLCPLHRLLDQELARTEQTFAATSVADLIEDDDGGIALCDRPAASIPLGRESDTHGRAQRGSGE
jgi:Rrf2 family nitric oxide-sensitive transcriptional repressor